MTQTIAVETQKPAGFLTDRALRVLAGLACNPLISHILFPIYIAALWAALYLRNLNH
jgi:uncharacterized RDD family membrane protein YckC